MISHIAQFQPASVSNTFCDVPPLLQTSGGKHAVHQGYSTSVASGPNKKITGGVRAAQNIDQITCASITAERCASWHKTEKSC